MLKLQDLVYKSVIKGLPKYESRKITYENFKFMLNSGVTEVMYLKLIDKNVKNLSLRSSVFKTYKFNLGFNKRLKIYDKKFCWVGTKTLLYTAGAGVR